MERGDGPDQAAEVDSHQLVIGFDAHSACEFAVLRRLRRLRAFGCKSSFRWGDVREEVEDVLKVAQNGVVDGQFAVENLL